MSEATPDTPLPPNNSLAAEKVRSFPQTPGVYLMKDDAGRVIYVGKAKNLRRRAGSYFLKAAAEDPRTARLVQEIRDIDYLEAESEVDALLMEARLIKDIQPKFNRDLSDDKTFPYLEIFTRRGFSPRASSRASRRPRGTKLYGPFANRRGPARGDPGAAEDLQVPHLHAGHRRGRRALAVVPPVPAGTRSASARRRATCGSRRRSTARTSAGCSGSSKARRSRCWTRCGEEMAAAAKELRFEEAARLRDEIELLETLDERGELETHVQPEVFPDRSRRRGWPACRRCCTWPSGRGRSKASTSPTWPARRRWPAWCSSSTGCRSSRATGGCKIRGVAGRRRLRPASTRWSPGGSSGSHDEGEAVARHPADRRRQGAAQRGAGGLRRAGASSRRRSSRWPSARRRSSCPAATSRCG